MFSASGGLSTQQQKKARAEKRAAVEQMYENEFKRIMKQLGEAIKAEQGKVRDELKALRDRCISEREAVSQEADAEFEAALEKAQRRKASKKVQTQFADDSGRAIAEKKTKQTSILDRPKTKKPQSYEALLGEPF